MKKVGPKHPPGAPHPSDTLLAKNFAQVRAASIPMPNSPAIALLITGYPSDKFLRKRNRNHTDDCKSRFELDPNRQIQPAKPASVALKNRM